MARVLKPALEIGAVAVGGAFLWNPFSHFLSSMGVVDLILLILNLFVGSIFLVSGIEWFKGRVSRRAGP